MKLSREGLNFLVVELPLLVDVRDDALKDNEIIADRF